MPKTTEVEIKFDGGHIVSSKVKDGICRMVVEVEDGYDADDIFLKEINKIPMEMEACDTFVLVEASKLSLTDIFMTHGPRNERERNFKELLTKVIKAGVSDFYRPKFDPSLDSEGEICYQVGLKPAVEKSYNWWEKKAKEFCPERKSRLGTKSEYVAFLGVLIKKLIKEGWSVEESWNAVCNDSKKLGHYWNSEGALHGFETTGSREIYGFYDLANTYKILAKDIDGGCFWVAGGSCRNDCYSHPLTSFIHSDFYYHGFNDTVGWLVLEK